MTDVAGDVPAYFRTDDRADVINAFHPISTGIGAKERPQTVAKMVAATQRSWEAGLKDPEAAVQALLKISEVPLNANVLRDGLKVFQGLATNG